MHTPDRKMEIYYKNRRMVAINLQVFFFAFLRMFLDSKGPQFGLFNFLFKL